MKISKWIIVAALLGTLSNTEVVEAIQISSTNYQSLYKKHHHHAKDVKKEEKKEPAKSLAQQKQKEEPM